MDFDPPDFRVTVRRDRLVRLVDWAPWLAAGGPLETLLDARGRAGVCIADLTVLRDPDGIATELIAALRCGDAPAPREALAEWAARVGYRRLWLDGDVRELEPGPGGKAETRCSGCRARFVDADPSFWELVRRRGAFPAVCRLCGADLPQWTAARRGAKREIVRPWTPAATHPR